MSSIDSDIRTSAAKRSTTSRDTEDLAAQIDAIRVDIQNVTSTVGRIADKHLGHARDRAIEKAQEAEEAIRRNPLSADEQKIQRQVDRSDKETSKTHKKEASGAMQASARTYPVPPPQAGN
jgi:sRNA-binding protein